MNRDDSDAGFRYYSFDESLMRQCLGKKLSSKDRNEIEDFHSSIKMSSRIRQFENLKRIRDLLYDFFFFVDVPSLPCA